MATQGSYPLDGRTLAPTDNVTGVVTGATADIPLSVLAAFVLATAGAASGPTFSRPTTPAYIGQQFFDTTLGQPIWVQQLLPSVVWVNAAGVAV
jgi:hypothetical protein